MSVVIGWRRTLFRGAVAIVLIGAARHGVGVRADPASDATHRRR